MGIVVRKTEYKCPKNSFYTEHIDQSNCNVACKHALSKSNYSTVCSFCDFGYRL